MPTYEYQCAECGIVFERFQHFSEEPIKTCPECNGPVHRVFYPVGIIFKGSGFYVTDHRGNNATTMGSRAKSNGEGHNGKEAKGETAPAKAKETDE